MEKRASLRVLDPVELVVQAGERAHVGRGTPGATQPVVEHGRPVAPLEHGRFLADFEDRGTRVSVPPGVLHQRGFARRLPADTEELAAAEIRYLGGAALHVAKRRAA